MCSERGHELGERGDGEGEGGLATDQHLAGVGIGDEEGGGGDVLWTGDFGAEPDRRLFEPGELGFSGGVDDGEGGAGGVAGASTREAVADIFGFFGRLRVSSIS